MDLKIENHGNMLKAYVTAEPAVVEQLFLALFPEETVEALYVPGERMDGVLSEFLTGVFRSELSGALDEMVEIEAGELEPIRERGVSFMPDGSVRVAFDVPFKGVPVEPELGEFSPSGEGLSDEELKRELFEFYLDNYSIPEHGDLVEVFAEHMEGNPELIPMDAFLNKIAYTLSDMGDGLDGIDDYAELAQRFVRASEIVRTYTHTYNIDEQFLVGELDKEVGEYIDLVGDELYGRELEPESVFFTLDSFDLCVLYTRMVEDLLQRYQGLEG